VEYSILNVIQIMERIVRSGKERNTIDWRIKVIQYMNDLKQVVRISKLSDMWEEEIDSKMDIDWTMIYDYDWNINEVFITDENIKSYCMDKLNDRLH
jgi:hypothetical protein